MTSLSPEARARLAAFREAESPDAIDEARCLAAVERRAASPTSPAPPRRRTIVLGGLALAAGLLLAARWATIPARQDAAPAVQAPHQAPEAAPRDAARPETRAVPSDTPATPSPVPSDTSSPSSAPAPSDTSSPSIPVPSDTSSPSLAPVPSDTSSHSDGATTTPPVPPDSLKKPAPDGPRRPRPRDDAADIAAEVALLREAKLAAPARRRELLDEHARRFPTGAFAAERGLLAVETLCELGDLPAARAAAARFRERHHGSPLAARIDQTCAEAP